MKYTFKKLKNKMRFGYVSQSGRNSNGIICVNHRGGMKSHNVYIIDYIRRMNILGYVSRFVKLIGYSGFLALMIYQNGLSNYILISEKVKISSWIYCGTYPNEFDIGASVPISYIPLFGIVNNIEVKPYLGSSVVRAAGASAILTTKLNKLARVKLKSGWNLTVSVFNICAFGNMSHSSHHFERIRKAGINRSLGIRPTVRGVAQNPCDHPHGGGEGKASPSAAQRSPWGWLTKGTPSLHKKRDYMKRKLLKAST